MERTGKKYERWIMKDIFLEKMGKNWKKEKERVGRKWKSWCSRFIHENNREWNNDLLLDEIVLSRMKPIYCWMRLYPSINNNLLRIFSWRLIISIHWCLLLNYAISGRNVLKHAKWLKKIQLGIFNKYVTLLDCAKQCWIVLRNAEC